MATFCLHAEFKKAAHYYLRYPKGMEWSLISQLIKIKEHESEVCRKTRSNGWGGVQMSKDLKILQIGTRVEAFYEILKNGM